jgi:hypothetical protein
VDRRSAYAQGSPRHLPSFPYAERLAAVLLDRRSLTPNHPCEKGNIDVASWRLEGTPPLE